jgi:hypothetical protein
MSVTPGAQGARLGEWRHPGNLISRMKEKLRTRCCTTFFYNFHHSLGSALECSMIEQSMHGQDKMQEEPRENRKKNVSGCRSPRLREGFKDPCSRARCHSSVVPFSWML